MQSGSPGQPSQPGERMEAAMAATTPMEVYTGIALQMQCGGQLQLIRAHAAQPPEHAALVTMVDIAAQMVITVNPHCPAALAADPPTTRGLGRVLSEPNALGEALRQVRRFQRTRGSGLSSGDFAQDLAQVLLMVETGGRAASVTQADIQLAARQVQRAAHLLSAARDASFHGDLAWNTERHWAELLNLLQPGANCCERRLFPGGAHMEDRETLGRAGEPPPTRRQLAGDERGGLPQHQTRYKPRKNGPGNLQPILQTCSH